METDKPKKPIESPIINDAEPALEHEQQMESAPELEIQKELENCNDEEDLYGKLPENEEWDQPQKGLSIPKWVYFVVPALLIVVIAVLVLVLKPCDGAKSKAAEPAPVTEEVVKVPARVPAVPTNAVTTRFSGTIVKGYPHGTGTLTFLERRTIDVHDEKGRIAEKAEYIIGEWDNGHLIQGRWYSADNVLKETIVIGKVVSIEKDYVLGRCDK